MAQRQYATGIDVGPKPPGNQVLSVGAAGPQWKKATIAGPGYIPPAQGGIQAAFQGGGGSTGGAPPPGMGQQAASTSNVEVNPYLSQVFGMYKDLLKQGQDLYGKALDPTSAIQNYEDMRAQGMKELQAQSGARGFRPGTGMSLAQQQDYLMGSDQGEQQLAADWQNKGLQFQAGLLGQLGNLVGGAGGTGANIAQNQLGLLGQGLQQQQYALDAWYKQNMLPIEMQKARNDMLVSQMSALSGLTGALGSLGGLI
jgi:hypothetical protein